MFELGFTGEKDYNTKPAENKHTYILKINYRNLEGLKMIRSMGRNFLEILWYGVAVNGSFPKQESILDCTSCVINCFRNWT